MLRIPFFVLYLYPLLDRSVSVSLCPPSSPFDDRCTGPAVYRPISRLLHRNLTTKAPRARERVEIARP
jgi:hypothetical protein